MLERSKLLVEHGFIKEDKVGKYEFNDEKKIFEPVEGYELSGGDANEEVKEINYNGIINKTGFPVPLKSFRISLEVFDLSLEGPYFWVLEDLQQKFPIIEKLEDSFAAAENSAFFGITQTRLGGQQDKVTQFLATMGKMIKELFQMVRELRIIDERLAYYEEVGGNEEKGIIGEVNKPIEQRGKSAEVTLKGLFVDLVQGGGKSAASVYGMARELEFITLPDLFFDAPPFKTTEELESHVNNLGKDFNGNVLRVLMRHLRQFTEWRQRTAKEHANRKVFQLKYLKQHFEIIKMYLEWVKPYLRHVAHLSMKESNMSKADLITAFEGSLLDIEILARKRTAVGKNGANGCVLATFNYRTRPEMKVVQEGYQRGPVHIGRFEMNLRLYGWNDRQVEGYKKLKEKENLEFMGEVSSSIREAMESLGDELTKYLEEANDELKGKKKEKKEVEKTFMEKFLGDFYVKKKTEKKKEKPRSAKEVAAEEDKVEDELEPLVGYSKGMIWLTYKNFKKAHRMIMW